MDISFQKKVDRIAGPVLCRLLSLLPNAGAPPAETAQPGNILVILLSEMGSLVLAHPMVVRLREKYPRAEIHFLVFEKNRDVLELLGMVEPRNIHTINDRSFFTFLADCVRVTVKLRRIPIDTAIDCELFARAGSLLSYLSGAVLRVGFHRFHQEGLYRGNIVNRPVPYNPYVHISRQFLALAEACQATGVPPVKGKIHMPDRPLPLLEPAEGDTCGFYSRFKADYPEIAGLPLVLIYAGGGVLPVRAWPETGFIAVARTLESAGYAVGIIGMEEDRSQAERIVAACGSDRCVNMAGYTRSVGELVALFHTARCLVTSDGGPGHFAALTRLPAVTIFGPETPVLYAPLNPNGVSLFSGAPCSPCLSAYNHRSSPCDGQTECLRAITPQQVCRAVFSLMEETR